MKRRHDLRRTLAILAGVCCVGVTIAIIALRHEIIISYHVHLIRQNPEYIHTLLSKPEVTDRAAVCRFFGTEEGKLILIRKCLEQLGFIPDGGDKPSVWVGVNSRNDCIELINTNNGKEAYTCVCTCPQKHSGLDNHKESTYGDHRYPCDCIWLVLSAQYLTNDDTFDLPEYPGISIHYQDNCIDVREIRYRG